MKVVSAQSPCALMTEREQNEEIHFCIVFLVSRRNYRCYRIPPYGFRSRQRKLVHR